MECAVAGAGGGSGRRRSPQGHFLAFSASASGTRPLIEREKVTITGLVPPLALLWLQAAPRSGKTATMASMPEGPVGQVEHGVLHASQLHLWERARARSHPPGVPVADRRLRQDQHPLRSARAWAAGAMLAFAGASGCNAGMSRSLRISAAVGCALLLAACQHTAPRNPMATWVPSDNYDTRRAQVIVLMCDGTQPIADQDTRLLALATERGRAVVLGLNKMDLLTKSEEAAALQRARDALHFAPWIPIVRLSAVKSRGLKALMNRIDLSYAEYTRRIPTSQLNRFFEEVLERRAPPTQGGKAPRLFYVTQAQSKPPLFIAMCNAPDSLDESYKRFVINQLRAAFGFEAVPIRVRYRARRRRSEAEG